MMKKFIFIQLVVLFLYNYVGHSADISVFGNLNAYISSDFNEKSMLNEYRPNEVFNAEKGKVALNNAILGINVDGKNYYSKLSLQFAEYRHEFNIRNKPEILDAHIGYRISNKLSLDGGYFLTNKGNEIFSQENLQFNSLTMNNYVMPISVAGLRINYKIKQFSFSTMLLNSMEDRNSRSGNFAIGIDIKYLDSIFDVNYNGIYGREEYTGFELFRMYNNLSIVAEILKDLKVGMELNSIGIESEPVKKATSRVMNTISFNSKYNFIKDFSLALRYAMIDNQDNLFFIPQKVSNDIAIALEYKPSTKSFIRFEVRNITLDGTFRDLYFSSENEITNSRTDISINFGMVFDRLIKE